MLERIIKKIHRCCTHNHMLLRTFFGLMQVSSCDNTDLTNKMGNTRRFKQHRPIVTGARRPFKLICD